MPHETERPRRPDTGMRALELLDLVGDEYTQEVMAAVSETPRSATEVAAATSVSEPTAFRRLGRLEEFGLVSGVTVIDTESGHHCKRFRTAATGFVVEFGTEEFSVILDRE